MGHDIKEKDWKLFREKSPEWQEAHMEKLLEEYQAVISEDANASARFWKLEKRLRRDIKSSGVILDDIRRSTTVLNVAQMIAEGVITFDDLADFSEEFQNKVRNITGV